MKNVRLRKRQKRVSHVFMCLRTCLNDEVILTLCLRLGIQALSGLILSICQQSCCLAAENCKTIYENVFLKVNCPF